METTKKELIEIIEELANISEVIAEHGQPNLKYLARDIYILRARLSLLKTDDGQYICG